MSSILYYSNFCQHSKSLLQNIGNSNVTKDVHFICIDKRVKEANKLYIVLENGQKIVMPESVTKVPALLLLSDNYRILYGEDILRFFKATQNNLEPMAFALGGGGSYGVTSDSYSFLDMDSDSLAAKGNGGTRQMHNYVSLNYMDTISTPQDETNYKGPKLPENVTVEQLMQQREMDLKRK